MKRVVVRPLQFEAAANIVAQRKQTEEALLEAGALQRAIFNSANFSSIATDARGVIQIFNVGAERMLGYTALEVLNKITPADISDPQEVIKRAKTLSAELGTPITPGFEALVFKASRGIEDIYELTYIRKDGSRFPAVVSVTALRDAQDVVIGYLLIGTDNTARKQAEKAITQLQRLPEQILNSVGEGLHGIDLEGNVIFANPAAVAMLGWSVQEMVGHHAHAMMHHTRADGSPYPPSECHIYATLRHGATFHIEDEVFWCKDGTSIPVAYTSTPMKNEAGEIEGAIVSFLDISERKRAQDVLNQANATLALQYRLLDTADQTKTEFMANVTHELRTPLNSVIGFAELLKDEVPGPLNAKQAQFAADILASGQRLLALVEGILEMSRLDAAGVALEREPVDIDAMLEERVAAHRKAAEARRIGVALEVPADVGSAELDPQALRRMLDALLDNAIKFNHEDGEIGVSARRDDGWLEIAVADTGIGIAPADLVKLFKPLAQLNAGLVRQHGGVGLGLALAHRLAEWHGGTIKVESEPGKGSTFTLRLPLQEKS
ncbi:MAG: PAS domain-containing sensor histidine kinase [Betaproteobacteria bacterium HGW-Betaproteobacteria-18]|nr:MAG: PAS domain-containing sensor histidine kinase [Betaproteobacteria bacterium HGW-Betaproteobacteria-18]